MSIYYNQYIWEVLLYWCSRPCAYFPSYWLEQDTYTAYWTTIQGLIWVGCRVYSGIQYTMFLQTHVHEECSINLIKMLCILGITYHHLHHNTKINVLTKRDHIYNNGTITDFSIRVHTFGFRHGHLRRSSGSTCVVTSSYHVIKHRKTSDLRCADT